MIQTLRTSVCTAMLFAVVCSACGKKEEKENPAPTPDPPSARPATTTPLKPGTPTTPAAQPAAPTNQKTRPLSSDEISELTKKIASGHKIHPEHSFAVKLKGFEGSMLATTGPNKATFVFHFFDSSGKRATSVFDKERDGTPSVKILAVAFEDADRDGYEDLVVLATYLIGSKDFNTASVYTRSGGGPFRFQEGLGEKAIGTTSMAAALAKIR